MPETPAPGPRRPLSLRLRLAGFAVLTLAVSLGLVGLALDGAYRRSSESGLREQMQTWVYLVLGATEVAEDGSLTVSDDLGDPRLAQPGSGVYAHLHGAKDQWNSPSSLGLALPELPLRAAGAAVFERPDQADGYYAYQFGVAWELPGGEVLPFTVSVLVEPRLLEPQIRAFRRGLWRSLGTAGLILALAQLLFGALGLRPLRRVADDVALIERGEAEDLVGPYPRELEPLTRNLNRLLQTEKNNLSRYRHALDSLAHSLKTPLAVIRAGLHEGRQADRPAMEQAVDDMRHLIASRLERAAAGTRRTLAAPVKVEAAAQRLAASLRKVHSQDLQSLDVTIDPGLKFYGEERDLLEILGNLLENACKYGDGRVQVTAEAIGATATRPGIRITVENGGSPVPPERLQQFVQRGVRGDERVEGHGLGLTIVSEVVAAYGGELGFGQGKLGGLEATVTIPPA